MKKNKIAILMNNNSYVGREYLSHLKDFEIDVITIGKYGEDDLEENIRCGNKWKPTKQNILKEDFVFFNFNSLKSTALINFLKKQNYSLCIQGGTGIINREIISSFSNGILNFHPGDLPKYRGCSAPEWQIYENNNVICTCHFIDSGIDSGDIIKKKKLNVNLRSYQSFRASIYPEIAKFVKEILTFIQKDSSILYKAVKQNEDTAVYREYIGSNKIEQISNMLKKKKDS